MGLVVLASVDELVRQAPGPIDSWMSEGELHNLAGVKAAKRYRQFIAGHFLARRSLASLSGGRWQDWQVTNADSGAPLVRPPAGARPEPSVHLSLSHSGDHVACAVASQPIGVDVEMINLGRDTDSMIPLCMGPREQALLFQRADVARARAFYAHWVLKEAWLKQAHQPASMQAIEFCPCDAEAAQAWLFESDEWALALVGMPLDAVTLDGINLSSLRASSWARMPV